MDSEKKSELASKWRSIASEDYQMAEIALANGKLLYAAFHLQQSMEKSLKGKILFFQGTQPPYLHDLVRLAEILAPHFPIDSKIIDFFAELNPFYIRARYPDYKTFIGSSLDKETVDNLMLLGKEVLAW